MRHIKFVLAALLIAGLGTSATADVLNFRNPAANAGFQLINQGFSGVELRYSIKEMALNEIVVDGQPMQVIQIPGVILPNNAGAPNLPGIGRSIAIPEGATASFRIVSFEREVLQNIELAPAPVIPFENDNSPLIIKKDPEIYNRNAYYPESPVMLSEPREMRGVDYVILGITPFQYNPVTKELIIYHDIQVEVDFIGGNGHFGEDRLRSRYWEPVLRSNLVNYDILPEIDFNRIQTPRDEDEYEYIIIIPDDPDFEEWADTIAAWRNLQGILTGVVPLSEIGGNNANAIETYINDAYNTWDIPPVAFLLLSDYQNSGDAYGITSPSWNGYCVSDNIYADVNVDDLPDIAHARITAQNGTHLEEMVNKFLDYERDPPTDPYFYQHPIIAGGWQTERWFILCTEICYGYLANELGKDPTREYAIYSGTPGTQWSSNPNTYMLVNYFGPDGLGYIPATPEHLHDWGSNATRVNNAINAGAFMLMHRDHGGVTGWGEPNYSIGDLGGLHNEDLPFVFSINCLTGQYDYSSECFAEAFHRMQHGALGLIAASQVSYSFVNDTYIFGIMDYLWPDFDPGYGEPGSPNLNPCFANVSGKHYLAASSWPYNPQNKVHTYHLFHHHGDAFITMYSEVPQELTVSHANILFSGFEYFTVTANNGAFIALTVDGEIIGTGVGTGGPLDITIEPQDPGGTMIVTVTMPNYYRYEESVDIIPPEGYGVVEGYVTDLLIGDPLQAMVSVINRNPEIHGYCQNDGYYSMYVPADTVWDLRAEHTLEYLPAFAQVSVAEDDTARQDFALDHKAEIILKAAFGNPEDIAYRTFYCRGSWDNDGFYDPDWDCPFAPMRDDGVAPDEVAGDGIFTGAVLVARDSVHTYDWAVYAEDYNDDASRLQNGAGFTVLDPTNPPQVATLQVNPTGSEHNFTLTCEESHGFGFDLTPGFNGQPHIWYGTVYIPAGISIDYTVKVMRTDDVYYGDGGIGGGPLSFTAMESGSYTFYFNDEMDLTSTGANMIVIPSWLEVSVMPGDSVVRELTLSNNGELDLEFTVSETVQEMLSADYSSSPGTGNSDPEIHTQKTNPPKTMDRPEVTNPPVTDGSGGPDDYGYTWIDSDEPGGPAFNWIDISGIGTPIDFGSDIDDGNSGPLPLGFPFMFYGNEFESICVCTNGWASFTDSTSVEWGNPGIPDPEPPNNMLAAFYDDMNFENGGTGYFYTNSSDTAIITWDHVPDWRQEGIFTFQIILVAPGKVVYQYLELGPGRMDENDIGIEDENGSVGLQIANNQTYAHDSLAVKISASWIGLDPISGSIPVGGEATVNVTLNASNLTLGDYHGMVTVSAWDVIHNLPEVDIPVQLHVVDNLPYLDLAMHPASSPVQVPAGGSFDFSVSVTNNVGSQVNYDAWLMLTVPNGNLYGPLAQGNFNIGAGQTAFYELTQHIPGFAPLGDYIYRSYVGQYPTPVVDEASFPFEIVAGYGGGADSWKVDGFEPRLLREGQDEQLPQEYSLSQNYPNPFNARSVIEYALPQGGKVDLTVYNLLGQKVETIVDSHQQAGYHNVTWDASDYASGIYFYTLKVNGKRFVKRMTLLK
jgi:hypothetical protein